MFIGYAEHSAAYRFFVLKSDVLERNTIVETKNFEFFEHIYPLSEISRVPICENDFDNSYEVLRRSKRQKKEFSFGNDFYTYLVEKGRSTLSEAFSSPDAPFWKKVMKTL